MSYIWLAESLLFCRVALHFPLSWNIACSSLPEDIHSSIIEEDLVKKIDQFFFLSIGDIEKKPHKRDAAHYAPLPVLATPMRIEPPAYPKPKPSSKKKIADWSFTLFCLLKQQKSLSLICNFSNTIKLIN